MNSPFCLKQLQYAKLFCRFYLQDPENSSTLSPTQFLQVSNTLHPSELETTIVRVWISCPLGTIGISGGNLRFGKACRIRTIPYEASVSAKSSVEDDHISF